MPLDFDVIVLGGGAAGLMCAIEAGKRGRRVAVLEHADRVGKKILISGGGRCNFTNLALPPGELSLRQSAFLQIRAGALHAGGLHRAGREAPHPLSREEARTAFLRSVRPARSSQCWRRSARPRVSRFAPAPRCSDVRRADDFEVRDRQRSSAPVVGGRDRRTVDPEDRRDRLRLRRWRASSA